MLRWAAVCCKPMPTSRRGTMVDAMAGYTMLQAHYGEPVRGGNVMMLLSTKGYDGLHIVAS